jgi:hypothetical protein
MATPNSVFFENLSPFTSSLPRIEASPLSLPPHRIRSYAMWMLVIVENENVGSRSGLQWHNVRTKRNENRPTALSVLTIA